MHRYKFQGDYRIRSVFTQAMAQQLDKYQADIITTVPIAQQTWLTRGFNQVQGIIDRPTEELLAVISNEKRPQSTRDRQERLALKQPFCWVDDKSRQSVYGKRVVLVDDVYTTGRTMYHAAGLFREAGVKSVKTFSLAG
ncbi:MAG TPA: ComF family protein [Candidatus Limosilactobacillus merdipullorum]|uniref:ComF family protein n=1 Tax=Candidatus Limosilactobacillus merdipullorum TaxID=2838653 RepID=A0A9D1QQ83_9LACO|nr:ComF family protein [Candidatus Limosilactobacillus merdipullorum]